MTNAGKKCSIHNTKEPCPVCAEQAREEILFSEDPKEYDNSVLGDAESMCRAAAYRLFKAMRLDPKNRERNRLVGEARALLHGVEARIK